MSVRVGEMSHEKSIKSRADNENVEKKHVENELNLIAYSLISSILGLQHFATMPYIANIYHKYICVYILIT